MNFDITQIQEWIGILFTIIGAGVTFASVIVKLTPTQTDDAILAKIVSVFDTLSVFNPNGTTVVKDDDVTSQADNQ